MLTRKRIGLITAAALLVLAGLTPFLPAGSAAATTDTSGTSFSWSDKTHVQVGGNGALANATKTSSYKKQKNDFIISNNGQGPETIPFTCTAPSGSGSSAYTECQADNVSFYYDQYTYQCQFIFIAKSPYSTGESFHGGTTNGGPGQCEQVGKAVDASFTIDNAQNSPSGTPTAGGGGSTSDDKFQTNCAGNSGAFAWLVCPAFGVIQKFVNTMYTSIIQPGLEVTPLSTSDKLYDAWTAFRNLANVLFVVAFLVIIFANVLSINIDAYTIKKMLPRLVAAAILVQFSFLIASLMIDIGNVLGQGVAYTINTVIHAGHPSAWSGGPGVLGHEVLSNIVVFGILGTAAFGAAIIAGPGLLLMGLSLVIALLGLVFTLVLRRLVIDVLVVLAPVAFVAWILPNTENLFTAWWKNFVRIILMYALISLVIGMGRIVQLAATGTSGISEVVGILAPVIAFFFIPTTFKMAGGIMSATGSFVQKRSTGYQKSLKGSQLAKNIKEDNKLRLAKLESNKGLTGYVGGLGQGRVFGTARSGDKFRFQRAQSAASDEMKKRLEADPSMTSNDMMEFAKGNRTGNKSLDSMRGNTIAEAAVYRSLAEKGLYRAEHQAALNARTDLNDQQKDFIFNHARAGGGISKIAESNMVLAHANRKAISFDAAGNPRIDPGMLSAEKRDLIKILSQGMSASTLSKQGSQGIGLMADLGADSIGLVTESAVLGQKAPGVAANTSDVTRQAIHDAVLTAGNPGARAAVSATIGRDGSIIP